MSSEGPRKRRQETASDEMKHFLTNLKLIYEHGVAHSRNKSRIHLLLAIHNSHYVAEQILRDRAKHMTFKNALRKIGFEEIIKRVQKKKNIPDYNHLLQLNKIRNDSEHSNIIPDVDTVRFYVRIAGEFLKWACSNYYNIDYDSIALENMIYDGPIKRVMLEAKQLIKENDLLNASKKMYEALGAFKFMWVGYLFDRRLMGLAAQGIDLTNILPNLAFKIILADNEEALTKMMIIRSRVEEKDGKIHTKSEYPIPTLKNQDEAERHYEDILNIILTYQDRVPTSLWRASA